MDKHVQSNVPRTVITLDRLYSREREAKEADKADERQRKEEEKEARKAAGGRGLSRLFKRSPSNAKAHPVKVKTEPTSVEPRRPVGLTVGIPDANRLRPESAMDAERPGSAQSHRSNGSGSLLSPASPSDRQPRSPRTPKSPSLWERPTRSREGDVGFGDE
jgi:hypothetical protein